MPNVRSYLTHAAVAALAAVSAGLATYLAMAGRMQLVEPASAQVQIPGQRSIEVTTQAMPDIGREMRINVTERDPGNGSAAHRHPGSYTFGYILEGTYEVKINDGPVRQLKAGESFYESPGALHAISRNPSPDKTLRYLVIQVGDPTKPRTIPEQ
jgi:quercetin dioxygenase-like cupin family protein